MRMFITNSTCYTSSCANNAHSIEHNDVEIVAVNDPFIEPHYAVSISADFHLA